MAKSFDAAPTRVPAAIDGVTLTIHAHDSGNSGEFKFVVRDASGAVIDTRQGDLIPYLTSAQKSELEALATGMLAKARSTLPSG